MNLKLLKNTPPWEWPTNAGKVLLDALRDARVTEADRLIAVELAGDLCAVNDELVEALLGVLRKGSNTDDLRAAAAIALGPVLEHADTEGFDDGDEVPITEGVFADIQASLRKLHGDATVPKEVRRRILEASVRAPQEWHAGAVRAAYASDDESWRLTAVFCMRFIRGFDKQILQALGSTHTAIHFEAVQAAGAWGIDAAWPHVAALVASPKTHKRLLLAAIDTVAAIRPKEAAEALEELTESSDEDIAAAAYEAITMAMADGVSGDDEEEADEELPN